MASILKLFCDILRNLRSASGFVRHIFRRWALLLAFLGRRSGNWRPWDGRKRVTSPKAEQAKYLSPSTETNLGSRGYPIVSASSIPASVGRPRLSIVTQLPQQTASDTSPASPPSHRDHANLSPVFNVRTASNRGSSDSSIRTRSPTSDRPSIIRTHSRDESPHTPVSPPTQFPRAPYRQFGRGPSVSPSRQSSGSPSPTHHVTHHFEVDVSNPHPQMQVGSRNGPIDFSSAISHGLRRRQSSNSVVVGVVNPSTDSLRSGFFTDRPLTEEPHTIGSLTGHLSPVAHVPDPREGLPQHSTTVSSSSATSNFDPPAGRILELIHSEQVPRYTKDITVPRERTYYEIPPLTTKFFHVSGQMGLQQGSINGDCSPWVPAMHPDGALYFFDEDRRLFTDTDMHDPMLREEMELFYQHLQRILHYKGLIIPSEDYDLALDIMTTEDGQLMWSYYYACHKTRCLFWLGQYDATHIISELFGVRSPAHIKHRLESLYWTHWSLFPAVFKGRRLGRAVVDELVGILSHGCIDVITSKSSTLPFDNDTMQKMLTLVGNSKKSDAGLVYHTAGVTRLLSFFAHWRFLYFHGQNSARLERHRTVYADEKQKRTLLITSLSPVFFLAPEGYLRELEKKWVDEVIIEGNWRNFVSGLLKEWEQLILSSTVVLSVNVGFLAVPGVVIPDFGGDPSSKNPVVIFTSPAQIASCVSIVASAGSIMIGLILIRHSSPKQNEDPAGASTYLYQNNHRIFGLEPLAIIFSLPWAFLMWSMVTFFVALLLFCFGTSNTPTRISIAVTSVVVALPVVWCIQSTWGSSGAKEAWLSGLVPSIARGLDKARVTCDLILALINFRSPWGPPSSTALGRAGSAHSRPDRDGVGVAV